MKTKILQLKFNSLKEGIEGLKHKMLFPFLFVLYVVLVTYSNDFHELHPEYAIRVLFVSLFGVTLLYYLLSKIIDRKLAGITALLCSISFFTFQPQVSLLNSLMSNLETLYMNYPEMERFILLINALIIGFTVLYLNKKEKSQLPVIKFLNLFFAILVAINLVNIGYLALEDVYSGNYENDLELEINNSGETPSIYFIVPDKYTNLEVVENQFGYNHTPFVNRLSQEGFSFHKDAYSNYDESATSLASTLNMNYLQTMKEGGKTSHKDVINVLEDNKVQEFLRSQGYTYYHMGGAYTEFNSNADKSYNLYNEYLDGRFYLNRYENNLVRKTPLAFLGRIKSLSYTGAKKFEKVSEISKKEGKKFVFAHIMSPHSPHVLAKEVEEVKHLNPDNHSNKETYNQSMKAVNVKIEDTVNDILENEEDVIIIIQGDEGPTLPSDDNLKNPDVLNRRHGILFTHYTPNISSKKFENQINPVNTFRVIFNSEFGTDLDMIEGKTFHTMEGKEMDYSRRNLSKFVEEQKQLINVKNHHSIF